jgi:hypothetical protein
MIKLQNQNLQKQLEIAHLDSIASTTDGKHSDHTCEAETREKSHYIEHTSNTSYVASNYEINLKSWKYTLISANEHTVVLKRIKNAKPVSLYNNHRSFSKHFTKMSLMAISVSKN